jgi:hypothetical protein
MNIEQRVEQVVEQGVATPCSVIAQATVGSKNRHEQTLIQRRIDATDQQIDKLVYELYGLTPEEIAIVEGN